MKRFFENKINKAFTLAEILLVLAVVGIVASMVIPTVVRSFERQQRVMKLKKAYLNISNAIAESVTDNGFTKKWVMADDIKNNNASKAEFINKYIAPYLKVKENCADIEGTRDRSVLCTIHLYDSLVVYGNSLVLDDGTKYAFSFDNSTIADGPNWQKTMTIHVDINPKHYKKFEVAEVGKDVFIFQYTFMAGFPSTYTMNKLVPIGNRVSREKNLEVCSTPKTQFGRSQCAALIMKDGWKIKSDYPWQ